MRHQARHLSMYGHHHFRCNQEKKYVCTQKERKHTKLSNVKPLGPFNNFAHLALSVKTVQNDTCSRTRGHEQLDQQWPCLCRHLPITLLLLNHLTSSSYQLQSHHPTLNHHAISNPAAPSFYACARSTRSCSVLKRKHRIYYFCSERRSRCIL